MTACFLFITKVMPHTPEETEEQWPVTLTTKDDAHNKKQSYQHSRCFLHSGIKTLFVKDVSLKAAVSILAKKKKKAMPFPMGMNMLHDCIPV